MKSKTKLFLSVVLMATLCASVAPGSAEENRQSTAMNTPSSAEKTNRNPALLDPSLAVERAPDAFRVKLETTKGDVLILVNRSWAPNGADRFYNLVKIGFFNEVAFYRVIRGFMAQCGFNGDPDVTAVWSVATIADDSVTQANTRGMVTFAQPGRPNARTTQFFINFGDNTYLKDHGAFAPFGKVLSGMDVMESIFAGYGEGAPRGKGPTQGRIARDGNAYLKKDFPNLDYIIRATVFEAESAEDK